MLTIYGRHTSSNVQLVMWTVAEIGVPHDRLDYGRGFASTRTDDYLAMNPMALVPAMRDGDVVMFESAAIMRYLGSKYGDDTFYPKDPDTRGPLDTWAEWGKNTFARAVSIIFHEQVSKPVEKQDPAIIAKGTATVTPLAQILNERLTRHDWLGGDQFTFADVATGFQLYRYFNMDWSRPNLPALDAYYARLQTRPAFRDHAMVSFETLRGIG